MLFSDFICVCYSNGLCFQGPVFLRVQVYPCNRKESRALSFSEEKAHWQIPMNEVNIICDVATKDGIHLHTNMMLSHNMLSALTSCVDLGYVYIFKK